MPAWNHLTELNGSLKDNNTQVFILLYDIIFKETKTQSCQPVIKLSFYAMSS